MMPAFPQSLRPLALCLALGLAASCSCGTDPTDPPDSGTPSTTPDGGGGGEGDGGERDGGSGGEDAGTQPVEKPTDVNAPDNAVRDTDCDGLSDQEEFSTVWPGGQRTRPGLADSDGDGLLDGVEAGRTTSPAAGCTFSADAHPASRTNPTQADSDGDGCTDGAEDANRDGRVDPGETDASLPGDCAGQSLPDADADGLPDVEEDTNGNGTYEPERGETDWQASDSDGDGLSDGLEDANKNGRMDLGETDPRRRDTDCDGLSDGPTRGEVLGEDLNANGTQEQGETDPTRADSDADGLSDGLEKGVTRARAADAAGCPAFAGDADPTTTTDPLDADQDGDGIADGAEDANQDGEKGADELDPRDGTDGSGPQASVCRADSVRPVVFKADNGSDVQLALPDSFGELVSIPGGRGLMGYDATHKVAFLVWRQAAPAGATTPTQVESALRSKLGSGLTLLPTQTFDTWDGHKALGSAYEQTGSMDLKARANALANALVGADSGVLAGTAGEGGPFHLQAEWVYRSSQSVVGLIALTPRARMGGAALFRVTDTAGGSALAQFADSTAVQCEPFTAGTSKVDFLFVVDDSGSMASSQGSLARAATDMATKLAGTSLDWRIGMVTTSYTASGEPNSDVFRGFTTNIAQFQAWLTEDATCNTSTNKCRTSGGDLAGTSCTSNAQCWVGISGTGTERALGAARAGLNHAFASGSPAGQKMRTDALPVVVLLTDTRDQSSDSVSTFETYFKTGNPAGQQVAVHGIICPPDGERCHEQEDNTNPRHVDIITATNGVQGSIRDDASITRTTDAIVDAVIAGAGHKLLQKAPIGASLKVALAAVRGAGCANKDDVPRSRTHGFDFDGKERTVFFFGDCRAPAAGTQAAVSYRYWRDESPDADGAACDADCGGTCGTFEACNTQTCACECAPTACGPGQRFESSGDSCGCVCDVEALGCGAGYQADAEACACVCQDDCGGCPAQTVCHPSLCACVPVIE